ncbi:mechanosensitive ion channel family protein (plasmid) [Aneurinibacillus sp. Ricciae_BoGa-3]|uniref:mechanosensitive ion channel family protein n=1 Tax=Aneurinibacillus sp. Ricciae_BoGa-3 TaxID=3022697 RepID=UPI0023403855|nr:mechanosensitive ion channel family protein [Aneurinibacillus sp. Ricciae_BoGa-3]WCK57312.1 mechanosensitive ion channel family protein [Aneurinibacillus sp. Ricciae_BoGa-3]
MLKLYAFYADLKFTLFQQLPNVAVFLAIILFSWLFQHFILRYAFKQLMFYYLKKRLRFKKEFVEQIEKHLRHLFFTICVLIAFCYALNVTLLSFDPMVKILKSIVTFYIIHALFDVGSFFGEHPEELKSQLNIKVENLLFPFFSRVYKVFISVLGFTLIAYEWGYNLSGVITGLGIGGLALALGAKDMLSHIFGGIAIALDKSFSIGDWISTDSKIEGIVEDMNFRSTKIRNFDKAIVSIPNAILANQSIYNWSRRRNRRVRFYLGVEYATPPEKIQRVVERLRQVILGHAGVDNDAVYIVFDTFNQSSLDILVQYLTNTSEMNEFLEIKQDINYKIMDILQQECVTLALPSQTIYIESEPFQKESSEKPS